MATLNLGRIKPVFRGAYAGGTAYVVDDIVTSGGETFICIQASTGNATSNATYWTKLAEKGTNGTNGTDVGATLTTQGDILYRDGSGLQRLPKGTAGQVLQMNSGATAPEYGTVSSDWVLLHSTDLTSGNPNSFTIANVFSSTYKTYKIFWALNLGTNHYYHMSVQNSSNSNQGGQYYTKYAEWYGDQSTVTEGHGSNATGDGFRPLNTWYSSSTQHSDVGEMTLYNPADTTSRTQAQWSCSWNQGDNSHMGYTQGWGRCGNVGGGTHFKITPNGGDFENSSGVLDAYIKIYGLK